MEKTQNILFYIILQNYCKTDEQFLEERSGIILQPFDSQFEIAVLQGVSMVIQEIFSCLEQKMDNSV
jgi:hypothetical protein